MPARRMIVRPQSADRNSRSEPFEIFRRPQRSWPTYASELWSTLVTGTRA